MARKSSLKLLDTWRYSDDTGHPPLDVPIMYSPGKGGDTGTFSVEAHGVYAQSSDLEQLKRRVAAELKEKRRLTWEDWLVVAFERTKADVDSPRLFHDHYGNGVAIKLDVHAMQYASHLGRNMRRADEDCHIMSTDLQETRVRDTPENREALRSILACVNEIGDRMAKFLAAGVIQATLENVPPRVQLSFAGNRETPKTE